MKIEIAKPERFSQSGKSLLRLIQNNDMPTLDLLVRESVQNSLDAWNKKSNNVKVEFNVGEFESKDLAEKLEGITNSLMVNFGQSTQKYVSVSDCNTQGLTGDVNDPDGENGNLQKLIYQICRAQEGEGAGGSWGIGKTVYFRVGIGLVVYYSRVQLENGTFEERMAATLVEDETKDGALIPQYQNYAKRGVAWWGREARENRTVPIVEANEILSMLNVFGLKPYEGDTTGTRIIIPYIDEEKLLGNNVVEYSDVMGHPIKTNWTKSVEAYLKVAVQRWYMPRLNNIHYNECYSGPWLSVKINDDALVDLDKNNEKIEPLFQVIQGLYNRAIVGNKIYDDILSSEEVHREDVVINSSLENSKDKRSGSVVFVKVDKKVLKMIPSYNKFHPMMYLNKEFVIGDGNSPIVCYCRRPGMIVSYETVSEWTNGIPKTDAEHFIIGVFVLNSEIKLNSSIADIKLEEYVRRSELADHTSWTDINVKNTNPRIVSRIKRNVATKISKVYIESESVAKAKVNSGYSKFFGDMLLPPENFGKAPSIKGGKGKDSKSTEQHRDVTLSIFTSKIKYQDMKIEIPFEIKTKSQIRKLEINMLVVASDAGGAYTEEAWREKVGIDLPYEVIAADFNMIQWEGEKSISDYCHLNENVKKTTFKALDCEYKLSPSGEVVGVVMKSERTHSFAFKGSVTAIIKHNNYKVTIGVATERGEK